MKSIYRLKPWKDRHLQGLVKWLTLHGMNANGVTILGLISGLTASGLLLKGFRGLGLVLLLFSVFADLLDGAVARYQGRCLLSGKLIDATSDRLVEIAWVGSLIAVHQLPWWGALLPIGSLLLFLGRYIAFRHRKNTSYVMVTRFERMSVMICALVIPWSFVVYPLFLGTIIGTFVSTVQIFWAMKANSMMVPAC